jgi:flagellar biosynthesis/type III secretory pathway chaperone
MIDQEIIAGLELGNKRLDLLRELASSLQLAQTAVVRSDLSGIDNQTERQQELCNALRQLGSVGLRLPGTAVVGESRQQNPWARLPEIDLSPGVRQRWEVLGRELQQVEMQVSQLNRIHEGLLRRAQYTLQIFVRLLANSANTYTPPKCAPAVAPSRLQEASHV